MREYFPKREAQGYRHRISVNLHDDHVRFLSTLSDEKSVSVRTAIEIAMKHTAREERKKRNRAKSKTKAL